MKGLVSLLPIFYAIVAADPTVTVGDVTYEGLYKDQVESWLGIRYGQDTSGSNRFKPPRAYEPVSGTTVHANDPGPACPQATGPPTGVLSVGGIPSASEDCLRLNVARPNGTEACDKLPVMVYIHGGGFVSGSKDEPTTQPGGLIVQSVANGHPVINVELNYRLGVFGFMQSEALKKEGSENAGLRDQRLALEWVQDNIEFFGGDPNKVTIHGQSSGGLAVGMQILAYGAEKPAPFHRAICQSQALEGEITGNTTRNSVSRVVDYVGCNTTSLDSAATVSCLRNLTTEVLYEAFSETASGANLGDEWLPVVDGDFLPDAPSSLIDAGRFSNVSAMIGWCENDAVYFIDATTVKTANDTRTFFEEFLPAFSQTNLDHLLDLYPDSEFQTSRFSNGSVKLEAQVYRAGRILRDILLTCQPIFLGTALARAGNDVYFYNQNQTILTEILEYKRNLYGYGAVHTSEFAYMFGNLSSYNTNGLPFNPTASDYALQDKESRSWSSFAALGRPSVAGLDTLQGWRQADFQDENYGVYVIGGPEAGYSGANGSHAARQAIEAQHLQKRCSFLNSPEIIKQLQY
ncbi:related to para-nitrobenzyl esterase [Ramularia collo-cygni]|uniref:Carboxylic ester hydrolase n=1 Tax=Ramularia collo-cygni TaxID=112498 RepID=A0A2D3V372_9PEZI|nr:related to para-nitrobenzyl esterase [Ramularia collo-cygni]CZT21145.1 related to para-nitrobenzyl esterase [Ramularia collo-cygni]